MGQSFKEIHGKDDVLLSNMHASAPHLREYFTEDGPLDAIPLVSRTAKKENDTVVHGYIVSYEGFLRLQKAPQSNKITLLAPQKVNDFAQNARKELQSGLDIFNNRDFTAQILMMGTRNGNLGTCFVALSPALGRLYMATSMDNSALFTPHLKPIQGRPSLEIYQDQSASGFRQGKGHHVTSSAVRIGDKSAITDKTDNDEIVWLSSKTIAAVSHKVGEGLVDLLAFENDITVKEITAKRLASAHGEIFEDVRSNNVFYRVDNRENGRERELFTIIPDHMARFMNIDESGVITSFRKPTSQEFTTSTQAWVYSNFGQTKIIFTENPQKTQNNIRISLPDEQANLIDRILGLGLPDSASIQGMKFNVNGERPLEREWRPKGLITPESVNIRATFDVHGGTGNLEIEATKRPHLTQLILAQSELLVIQSGGREYSLTPS